MECCKDNMGVECECNSRRVSPMVDISEDEKSVYAYFDLPGIAKEDIKVNVEKDILTVSADSKIQLNKEWSWLRRETDFAGYKRSFQLGKNVDGQNIEAEFLNGVLKLTIAKRVEESKEIFITVK